MARISCDNCGAEISDKALYCPKCGVKVKKRGFLSKISKKIWITMICILGACIVIFLGSTIIQERKDAKLDSSEEYVLDCVGQLQLEKRVISLDNDILYSALDNGKVYVVIEFGSRDGHEMAYFENKVYIGTDSDYERMKNYDMDDVRAGIITLDELKAMASKKVAFATANVEIASWNIDAALGLNGTESKHLVSAKKIGKKLGIDYPQK